MVISFEQQRIPLSKKDKTWRKNMVDSICSRSDEFGADWFRMYQNYRLKNSQVDQEEFREYCDVLSIHEQEGKKFVEPFNKTPVIIEVLKGEEGNLPWSYGVINLSSNTTNEVLRDKTRDIWEYVDSTLALEIEKQQQIAQLNQQMMSGEMKPEEAQQKQQEFEQQFKTKQDKLLSPKEIEKKYSKYKTLKERTIDKLLRILAVNNNIKWTKNETFEDALIAGVEAVEVVTDHYTGMAQVRQINPLNLFFHKSPDSPFIHDSDYVGYKEEMSISDVLDKYGHLMEKKDIERLKTFNLGVYGINTPFHSDNGFSESHWDSIKDYEYTNRHPMSTVPNTGTSNVMSDGLYASDRYRYKKEGYSVVYTVYWKSQRNVGKMTYINEYGIESVTLVNDDYPLPKSAVKENIVSKSGLSSKRIVYKWTDAKDNPVSLEYIWIPEVWKGIRINGDIHVYAEPYENAYQSLLNPYKTKLPILGVVYNNRNAFSVSVMDRMKPWQKLYYVITAKWLKLITQDKGVIKLLNTLMMDKDLGYERTLQIAMDTGVLPYNPLAHSQGVGVAYSQKPAEALDLSNAEQLTHYTKLLEYVEVQLKLAAGVPDQRLAQTSKSTNVTDNQRDMIQSMNITNSIFATHDLLWQEVLQSMCETSVKSLNDKTGFIRNAFNDEEIAIIDLGLIKLEDEYLVRVANNSKAFKLLNESKQMAHALIQNDKINFSTLLSLLDQDSISEFKDELRAIEHEIEQREQQMQQSNQEHEKQMQDAVIKQQKEAQEQRIKEIELKGEYDIAVAQVKAMSWAEDTDVNDNDIPDIWEIDKIREDLDIKKSKIKLEERKVEQRDKELDMQQERLQMDNNAKNRDITSKERIAKERNEIARANKNSKPKK